ncbi:hypothetical protein CkaCkLH20_00829 [Colletotrichum karsti]|uniref:Oxidase ustYa n=1 Tax=Colletotrichum karsti TaxID=1095194 RepID=A0A9P6LPY5_9PEZI|nr:uncharacterized protein CkaCkLH20_00829 [Colletotrichum karsti]KAF9881683.1 hypothetical protein CkaCkLH20_00829 [Colletotrichum karsti]
MNKSGIAVKDTDANDYFAFESFNSTKGPYHIVNAADPSEEANEFWNDLKKHTGIVEIDRDWAQINHLPPTVPHPDDPNLRIYQVNAFHSLHCLYRIRNRLISKVSLDKWPRNDIHTMHCLDHIRNEMMCNVDISMSGSQEYISFNTHGHDRKCRDLGAIQRWAQDHAWSGYKDYLENVVNFDADEAERVNAAFAGKGKWNHANSTHHKETGKIDLWFEDHDLAGGH